jgi:enoyl-CoA hydratase/carnithine racemase
MIDCPEIVTDIRGQVGFITLNRPQALNALTLPMVRALSSTLLRWRDASVVQAVAIRGMGRQGPFGTFCAGGDIRFFHQAATAGDPQLEDFFTEEYALNHLIFCYPKPYIAFMDGIDMGGGMGISQGAAIRIVTERSRLGMPETHIGLFPDVGGGYFLSRLEGRLGEWLALTGESVNADQALAMGLADVHFAADSLGMAWDALADLDFSAPDALKRWSATYSIAKESMNTRDRALIDQYFSLESASAIIQALEADASPWARHTAAQLRTCSPLMLHVVLAQIRRARTMTLADVLRMERDMVRHCFFARHLERSGAQTETVEGIRALVIDKDRKPRWSPGRIEDISTQSVTPFFESPWPVHAHPLRDLA